MQQAARRLSPCIPARGYWIVWMHGNIGTQYTQFVLVLAESSGVGVLRIAVWVLHQSAGGHGLLCVPLLEQAGTHWQMLTDSSEQLQGCCSAIHESSQVACIQSCMRSPGTLLLVWRAEGPAPQWFPSQCQVAGRIIRP